MLSKTCSSAKSDVDKENCVSTCIYFPAAIMRNTGMLVCNDFNSDRVKALVGNFHRMGITNTVITCHDGRAFSKVGYVV